MNFNMRNGVVLVNICEEYLLVASKEARGFCPKVIQINETAADIWKQMQAGKSEAEIIQYFKDTYESNDIDLHEMVSSFSKEMIKLGYLI